MKANMILKNLLILTMLFLVAGTFCFAQQADTEKVKIYGEVLEVRDGEVDITLGLSHGITSDSKGKIYIVEKKEDGSGKIIYLADIEIKEIGDNISVAKIINSKGNIEKGNFVVIPVVVKAEVTPEVPQIELSSPVAPVPIGLNMEAQVVETVRLTSELGCNIDPVWTPQGDRLYFVSNRNNDYWNIYTMNVDGTGTIKLTDDLRRNFSPHISPDGLYIAFVSSRDSHEDIYMMKYDGTETKRLTTKFNLSNATPAWSPDGTKIAFVSFSGNPMNPDGDIYVVDTDGNPPERITMTGNNFSPHWSPDGKKLLFVSARTGYEEIYIMDLETKEVTQITELKAQIGSPRWSPDGTKIAFMMDKHHRSSHICLISSDGTHLQELTEGDLCYNYVPYWAPDGQSIVYISSESHVQDIYIMNLKWTEACD